MSNEFNFDDYPRYDPNAKKESFDFNAFPKVDEKTWKKIMAPTDNRQKRKEFDEQNPILSKVAGAARKGLEWGGEQLKKHPKLNSYLQEFGKEAEPWIEAGKPVSDLARTWTQNIGNIPISLANAPLQLIDKVAGTNARIPHLNFDELRTDSPGASVGEGIGNILSLIGPSGAPSHISRGLNALPRPGGWMGIFTDALKGAGAGYLLGEDAEGNRGLGTALGAGAHTLGGMTKSAIGRRVNADRNTRYGDAVNDYRDFFNDAERAGARINQAPHINAEPILQNATAAETRALQEFLENPSLNGAHASQSDLGKTIRRLEKINQNNGLSDSQNRALEAASDAQKRIRGSMHQSFEGSGNPEFGQRYGDLTQRYREEVIPFTKNRNINKYRRNEMSDAELTEALQRDKAFQSQAGHNYPEMQLNKYGQTAKQIAKKAGSWGGAGALGAAGFKGKDIFEYFLNGGH